MVDSTVCYGDMARYGIHTQTDTATFASVFQWTVEGGTKVDDYNDKIDVRWDSETDTGRITVKEIGFGGCESTMKEYIVFLSKPQVDLGFDQEICLGQAYEFEADPGYESYEWPDGSQGESYSVDSAGYVWVNVTNEFGCEAVDSVYLTVHDLPDVDIAINTDFPDKVFIGEDSVSFVGDEVDFITLDAGIWNWYDWNTGESMSTIDVQATDVTGSLYDENTKYYWVTVENEYGCRNSDSVAVTVIRQLRIPNAITPNGDGSNDKWEIPALSLYPNATVQIFDRWGNIVYTANGYDESKYWDGRDNRGRELPMDSYYYVIDLGKGKKPIYGNITIIR